LPGLAHPKVEITPDNAFASSASTLHLGIAPMVSDLLGRWFEASVSGGPQCFTPTASTRLRG
jgi:hypothetical protein